MKRTISLLLAMLMLVSLFPTSVYCDTGLKLVISDVTAPAGEDFSVTVSVKNNPGIASIYAELSYDETVMELISGTGNISNGTWLIEDLPETGTITWFDFSDYTSDGVILTLNFKMKDTATPNKTGYPVNIWFDPDWDGIFCAAGGDPLECEVVPGTVRVTCTHTPAAAVQENFNDSTCAQEGSYDEVVYCSVCGDEISRTPKTVAKKNHDTQLVNAAAADCEHNGYTGDYVCKNCHNTITAGSVITKLGHKYTIHHNDDTQHWDECERCHDLSEKTDHALTYTYKDEENHTVSCSDEDCSHTDTEAHSGGTATCTSKAVCSFCNHSYGSLAPHNYIEKAEEKYLKTAGTCTQKAVYYKSCSACGGKGTETFEGSVNPYAHTTNHTVYKAATIDEAGNVEYWYCSECGKYFADSAYTQEITAQQTVIPQIVPDAIQFSITGGTVCPDREITVDVVMNSNPGVGSFAGTISYDNTKLVFVSAEPEISCGNWTDAAVIVSGGSFSWSNTSNYYDDATVLKLTFKAKKDATPADTSVTVTMTGTDEGAKTAAGTKLNVNVTPGTITVASHATEHFDAIDYGCTTVGNIEYWHCTRCGSYFSNEACTTEITLDDTVIPAAHRFGPNGICTVCGEGNGINAFNGTCGENIKWTLDSDGILTISGTGAMNDYAADAAPWAGYCSNVSSLVIGDGVTSIGANAFRGIIGISTVTIPGSVASIGESSFEGCTNLTDVNIGDSVSVAARAFEGTEISYAYIKLDGQVVNGKELKADYMARPEIQLVKQFSPLDAVQVIWYSSDESIATVSDSGLVRFVSDGRVQITVSSVDESQTASVFFNAIYADGSSVLKAVADSSDVYVNDSISICVYGDGIIDAASFNWEVISGQSCVEMTAPGVFKAISAGTVTVRAWLENDPHGRFASVSFNVLEKASGVQLKINGTYENCIVEEFAAPDRQLKYTVTPEAPADSGVYKYKTASTNKTIASVKDLKDGSFQVVLASYVTGACTISFTPVAKVNGKDVQLSPVYLEVYIKDYAPKTENAVSLNAFSTKYVYVPVAECEDNPIVSSAVTIYDLNQKGTETLATKLQAEFNDGFIALRASDATVRPGTYKFVFTTEKGEYSASFKLTVKNSYPKLTVKQLDTLELYDSEDSAFVSIAVADGSAITAVSYSGTGYDVAPAENGVLFTRNAQPIKKGTLLVSIDGYHGTVSAAVTIKTLSSPSLALSSSSSTVKAGKGYSLSFKIYDKNLKQNLDGCIVSCEGYDVEASGYDYILKPKNVDIASGKRVLSIYVSGPGWRVSPLVLKYTLNVEAAEKLPTVKLKASSISLNAAYPEISNSTELIVSQANSSTITASFTCPTIQADKLSVEYNSVTGKIEAKILDAVPAGAYKFTGTIFCGEARLAPVSLTVKVVNAAATITAKAAGKLDVTNPACLLTYTITTKNLFGTYSLENAKLVDAVSGNEIEDFNLETAKDAKGQPVVYISLKDGVNYGDNGKLNSYSAKLVLSLGDKRLVSSKLALKLSQSALKVKADTTVLSVYQSQSSQRTVVYTINVQSPAEAKIGDVTLGSIAAVFRKNLADASSNISWNISPDGKSVKVYVTLKNMSRLTAGSTYTLPLVLTPEGAVNNKADAKINLSLKVNK